MTPQQFLAWLRPDNHLLTAIPPDGGPTMSRHFERADDPDIAKFIEHVQKQNMGVYYSLGVPRTDADKKARRAELAAAQAVYADLDPPEGMTREEGRAHIRAKLDELPFWLPKPTLVSSGNGMQIIFRLSESTTDFDTVEGVTRAISDALGGDIGVWDVSRVLRLPGTINYPNKKKRERGFGPSPAEVVEVGQPVPLHALADAFPPLPAPAAKAEAHSDIDFSVVFSAADFADLPADLQTRFDAIEDAALKSLWAGEPLASQTDTSGSGMRFALAQRLHLHHFSDTEIASLLWVAEHAGDQEKKTERTLARDVMNSRPEPKPDAVDEFEVIPDPPARTPFLLKPFELGAYITPRKHVYAQHITEGIVTALVAPPGVGKSIWTITVAAAVASGKAILGTAPVKAAPALVWNMEDARIDMDRRLEATARHYDLDQNDLANLHLVSGFDQKLALGTMSLDGPKLNMKGLEVLDQLISSLKLKLVVLDPFISVHGMPENENGGIDMVAKALSKLAVKHACSITVVHHTKKLSGHDATMEDSRGASSLIGAVRSGLVMNAMSQEDAKTYGIQNRHQYFRLDDGKKNFAPRSDKAEWYQLISVSLENAEPPYPADSVGVVTTWAPSVAEFEIEDHEFDAIVNGMGDVKWRKDARGRPYIGEVLDEVLGLGGDKSQITRALKTLLDQGRLEAYQGPTSNNNTGWFVRVKVAS